MHSPIAASRFIPSLLPRLPVCLLSRQPIRQSVRGGRSVMHEIFQGTTVIPVVTIARAADAVPLAEALLRGGLRVIEVTLRTAEAPAAIRAIARALPDAIVGAGTV